MLLGIRESALALVGFWGDWGASRHQGSAASARVVHELEEAEVERCLSCAMPRAGTTAIAARARTLPWC